MKISEPSATSGVRNTGKCSLFPPGGRNDGLLSRRRGFIRGKQPVRGADLVRSGGARWNFTKKHSACPRDAFLYLEREDHLFRAGRERSRFHGSASRAAVGKRGARMPHAASDPHDIARKKNSGPRRRFPETDGPRKHPTGDAIALELLGILTPGTGRLRINRTASPRADFIKTTLRSGAGNGTNWRGDANTASTLNRIFRSRNFQSPARYSANPNANAGASDRKPPPVTEIARRCVFRQAPSSGCSAGQRSHADGIPEHELKTEKRPESLTRSEDT